MIFPYLYAGRKKCWETQEFCTEMWENRKMKPQNEPLIFGNEEYKRIISKTKINKQIYKIPVEDNF